MLGVDPRRVELTRIDTGEGMWFVSGVQAVNGVPVYGAEVGFTLNAQGEVLLLGADAYPNVETSTTPQQSAEQAVSTALVALAADSAEVSGEPRLVIFPQGEPAAFHLAWEIRLYATHPVSDVTYFVDAQTGAILHSFSNLRHHGYARAAPPALTAASPERSAEAAQGDGVEPTSHAPETATGSTALATITIQGTISGQYWPEEQTDALATQAVPTTGIRLYTETGHLVATFSTNRSGYFSVTYNIAPGVYILNIPLQSSYAQARDGSNNVPLVNRTVALVSGTNTVNYTWPVSDRANVKRHAETMRDFFTGSPFNFTNMNYQMQAHVDELVRHPVTQQMVPADAFANGTHIYFGDAGGLPWEETAEVVRHEYTHNVVYKAYSGWICSGCTSPLDNQEIEKLAMDEGIPDYFSSTISGDHLQGETVAPPAQQRNLDNNTHNFTPSQGYYWNSQVISGALWDVRQALGAGIANRLAFQALRITPLARTFSAYGYNMVVADRQLYGGAYESTIRTYFTNHGISIPAYTPVPPAPTNLSITASATSNPLLSWNASAGATSYRIYKCSSTGGGCPPASFGTTTGTTFSDNSTTIDNDCSAGINSFYEVRAQNAAGLSAPSNRTSVCTESGALASASALAALVLPEAHALHASAPNPFSSSTDIRFDLPEPAHVRLAVYNLLGQEVRRLVDGEVGAGFHTATFEAGDLPSGVYLYRLTAGDFTQTHRMVLTK